jgi:hypothetical protein
MNEHSQMKSWNADRAQTNMHHHTPGRETPYPRQALALNRKPVC